MIKRGFDREKITREEVEILRKKAQRARAHILKMTTLAGCGHPGGSMSSLEMYLTLYSFANVFPDDPRNADRDRILISHGHTSPGVYAALGECGFFDPMDAVIGFRKAGSPFEGHVEKCVPGVEWNTGNLGQGLSAGCGFALAARLQKRKFHTFVAMSDGEQQKGQIGEARRFAVKYGLTDLTVLIDYNRIQISGSIDKVMPQNIKGNFESDGWKVIEVDGHDIAALYGALRQAVMLKDTPVCIMCRTEIGKGVSFMEGLKDYHGKALTMDECRRALKEIGADDDIDALKAKRMKFRKKLREPKTVIPKFDAGMPRTYAPDTKTDNRSAFGRALQDIAEVNGAGLPVAAFDCDLAGSVKLTGFAGVLPDNFFQGGVQEHNTAVVAGALSSQGFASVFAGFGVFGVDETYNQHRLTDLNSGNMKLVCTHVGLDVGEDGKTHQCLDYIGALRNLFGFHIIAPADPNQTDRAFRYMIKAPGCYFMGMGRSNLPIITDDKGKPFYAGKYVFKYGKADLLRDGKNLAVLTTGALAWRAVKAWEMLAEKGIRVKVYNVACPAAIDKKALADAAKTGLIVTFEDHHVGTGLGSLTAEAMVEMGLRAKLVRLGVPGYASSGTPDDLYRMYGLHQDSLAEKIQKLLKKK